MTLHIPDLDDAVPGQRVDGLPSVLQHDGGHSGVVPLEDDVGLGGNEWVPHSHRAVWPSGYEDVGFFVERETLDSLYS